MKNYGDRGECYPIAPSEMFLAIRGLKIQRRRRKRGRQKSNMFNNQNNNFPRASCFFVRFFAVTARLRRENA